VSRSSLLFLALLASPALAQDEPLRPPPTAAPDAVAQARAAAGRGDPAEALSRYLRILSSQPDNVPALTGAGLAALAVGDLNAAAGFFGRADARNPRSGPVKMGQAELLLQQGDARGALRLFRDAVDLGVPVADVAADRGLAYDLRGDGRRAQADYQLALRDRPSDEVTRRLAVSQAIGGDRTAALATLDPLLRRQDVPAWRTRAFIFALTGDQADALTGAALVMPRDQVAALAPYLSRLAGLRAGDKAAAIHLGRFPGEAAGPPTATAGLARSPLSEPNGSAIAALDPFAPAPVTPTGSAAEDERARQRALAEALADARARAAARSHLPAALRARGSTGPTLPIVTPPGLPVEPVQAFPRRRGRETLPVITPPRPTLVATVVPPAPVAGSPSAVTDTAPVDTAPQPQPHLRLTPAASPPVRAEAPPVPAQPSRAERLADERKRKAEAAAKQEAAAEKAAAQAQARAEKANPARHWVQVAGGANKADLGRAWDALKHKWPKQLAGRSPSTLHYRFTNRLLIGPFPTSDAAQDWVSDARQQGFSTFRVETNAGDPVERVKG
jgi:hypothetical protein